VPINPTYDSSGQVALVTCAASGMGLAISRAFAESGAAVTLADIDEGALTEAAGNLAAEASADAQATPSMVISSRCTVGRAPC